MVAAGVHDAEAVSVCTEIKLQLACFGFGAVFEIHPQAAAGGARRLIHQPAGLAEKFVFGIFAGMGKLHCRNAAAVVQFGKDSAAHYLERRGGGKPGAGHHLACRAGCKAADRKPVFAEIIGDTRNNRAGAALAHGGGIRRGDINNILAVALAFHFHNGAGYCGGNGDYIYIHASGKHHAVIVVGMVAGKLCAPGNGKQYRIVFAVKLAEFRRKPHKAFPALRRIPAGIKLPESYVVFARVQAFYKLACFHRLSSFSIIFSISHT